MNQKSVVWRAEKLWEMASSDWSEVEGWYDIPGSIRQELDDGTCQELSIKDPEHERFDSSLLFSLRYDYFGAVNNFLEKRLTETGYPNQIVTGEVEPLHPCPCCGLCTLEELSDWEICTVCWWMDDGQAHHSETLVDCRIKFLIYGISKPERTDLIEVQEPAEKFNIGRQFNYDPANRIISEPGTDWWIKIKIKRARRLCQNMQD